MAAGAWYSSAGLGDANIAVAARTIQVALNSAIKNKALLGHPVVIDLMARDEGLGQLMGELGVSIGLLTAGQGKLASTAEGTEASPTNWSLSNSTTVTPARRAYARDVGDYGVSLQGALLRGEIGPNEIALIAYDALLCWLSDVIDRIAALASSASNEIGTTATALTYDEVEDGVIDFKNRGVVGGTALGLLTNKGAKDLFGDVRSLGGAVQWGAEGAAGIQRLANGAFLGTLAGVDWYLNSELDTDGGDTLGLCVTPGAFLMKHQRVPLQSPAEVLLDMGWYTVERRRPGGGVTRFEYVSHNAVAILEQGRFTNVRYVT